MPRLAEATKVETQASADWEAKSKAWADAALAVRAAEEQDAEARFRAAYSGRKPRPHPDLARLRGQFAASREELGEAERALSKARGKAAEAMRRAEHARRAARDRESWPDACD